MVATAHTYSRKRPPAADAARTAYRLERRPQERVQLLGATVDLVRPEEVFHFVGRRLAEGRRTVIANHNMHSLALRMSTPRLDEFYASADLVEVDSVPLIAWARLLGHPARRFHRCTYLDWRDGFWARAEAEEWRVFVLAGKPGVAETACAKIRGRRPGLTLTSRPGWFDVRAGSAENAEALAEIEAFRPDILFVGMGMPRQELWVLDNLERLPPCAIFTVGGAFDYEAGAQAACPRVVGQMGMEWLFRLAHNPARLFHRYAVEPWRLLPTAAEDLSARLGRPALRAQD